MNLRINLKTVSFILAILLWAYVNLVISPTVRRTVRATVEYKNVPPLLRITPEKAEVEAVLTGTRRDFIIAGRDSILVRRDSIQIVVDLYNLRPGRAFFPLKSTTPSGLSVVAMKPAQIEITAETLVRREMDVEVEVKGQTAEGFLAESPVITPRRVTIEGPSDLLEKVTTCQATITLIDVKNSVFEKRPVMLFGPEGEIASGIRVLPDKVGVDVTVKAGYPSRAVPVIPQFINKPPEGYKLETYKLQPSFIMLSGPGRVLEELGDLRTAPIDLSLMQSSGTILVQAPSPLESLKVVSSSTIAVTVTFSPTPVARPFTGLPLSLKNLSGQHCIVSPASYTLFLEGPIEALNQVSPADLAVVLDVRSRNPGSFTVPLPCPKGLPKGLTIREIRPADVQITIDAVATNSSTTASASGPAEGAGSSFAPASSSGSLSTASPASEVR
ncbi:MAG: CdaR family protein [Candidatus Ozemobacteraceae bacterium]